ncbi:MAG: hypothetical protein COZ70_05835 [Deltaproteobacteria bacterium CG_4_8_14_3_um_filter_51_11]|nr:MAG: hypothetical protein AUK25_04165 [Desulfobacteraceae bacterium CG2_30_51_40]PIP45759.1 MAG: hypothetical protein COX16_11530 [Deltaproteobacteria bacterium CG23_combo_of_CG06-09_8_20_14_all_51_20]PIX20019.1 MAG: hypothetical protein COZ70_05835 [Deltaproteobacteria bacterium CG_4_8_14_3_um_filter_51_11]PIY27004.1 MAG: hypothetical protein COZ11_01220 [Deltaproteobacteria bacterium CG_4_10_14_3_um_filter_51_14]PJB38649.1 MAG: hypothetical protein CO107_01845 [Deltaproteobacteria bacteriu
MAGAAIGGGPARETFPNREKTIAIIQAQRNQNDAFRTRAIKTFLHKKLPARKQPGDNSFFPPVNRHAIAGHNEA